MVIAVPVGPVGVLCVRRTLFEGALFGIVSGIGAAVADVIFGAIAGLGLTVVSDALLGYQDAFGTFGGLYLLAIGARAFFKRDQADPPPLSGEKLAAAFASTFALTITNPITILAFAAIFAKIGLDAGVATWPQVSIMLGGVFAGSLLWWLGLSFGIAVLRKLFGAVHIKWLNRISGAILIASGIGLLASVALDMMGHPL